MIGLFSRLTFLLVAAFIGFCGLATGEASWARLNFRIGVVCCSLLVWEVLLGHNDLTVLRKRLEGRGLGPGALGLAGATLLAAAAVPIVSATSPTAWNSVGSWNAYSATLFPTIFFVTWLSLIALLQGRAIRKARRQPAAVGIRLHARSRSAVFLVASLWGLWLYWTWGLVLLKMLGFLGLAAVGQAVDRSNGLPDDTVALLVKLGPDDHIEELAPWMELVDGDARFVSGRDNRWIRVRVPADNLRLAAFLLNIDEENVDIVQGSARAHSEPTASEGPCRRLGAQPTTDPYSVAQPAFFDSGATGALAALRRLRLRGEPAVLAVLDHEVVAHPDVPTQNAGYRAPIHGQQVAAAAAAIADNGVGLASLNAEGRFVKVLNIPVLWEDSVTDAGHVAVAIDEARERGAAVINLSLGANGPPPTVLQEAIGRALGAGIIVVASAGNGGGFADAAEHWPANVPGVIVVAGHDRDGSRSALSNRTQKVARAVSAPGAEICLPAADGYGAFSGTSFATAQVSGGLAALRSFCPRLGPNVAWEVLRDSGHAVSSGEIGPRVQWDRALLAALRGGYCDIQRAAPARPSLWNQPVAPSSRPRRSWSDTGH